MSGAGKGVVQRRQVCPTHPLKDSGGSVLQTLPVLKALQPAVGLTSRLFPGYSFSHPGFVSPLLLEAEATFQLYRGGDGTTFPSLQHPSVSGCIIFPSVFSPLNNFGVNFPCPINLLSTEQFWLLASSVFPVGRLLQTSVVLFLLWTFACCSTSSLKHGARSSLFLGS